MEERGSAGGAERQVAKLVKDDEIGVGEPRGDLAGFTAGVRIELRYAASVARE
jgi:hypothetical protein